MGEHVNTKYPNLPGEFIAAFRTRRLELGISQRKMADDLEWHHNDKGHVMISQFERGERNLDFEKATKIRDYLQMDFDLPEPSFENAPRRTRRGTKNPVVNEPFRIVVDGELIEVYTFRRLGPVKEAKRVK